MSRYLIFAYGILCYTMFLGVFVYSIAFLGNLFIPNSIDAAPRVPVIQAILIDVGLLGLFAVQHSVMARPAFKRWWTKIVPEPAERATYVLFSNVAMVALFVFWEPIGGTIWSLEPGLAANLVYGLYFLGWAVLFYATLLLNHFELCGVRQVWLHLRGKPYTDIPFNEPGMYRYVRHPIYVGWLMIFWFTPVMTAAHLLFAVMTTVYILVAIQFEEKDLVDHFGDDYRSYKRRVGMLIPRVKKSEPANSSTTI